MSIKILDEAVTLAATKLAMRKPVTVNFFFVVLIYFRLYD
jgi:acyl-CoA hydrolase